MRTLQSQIGWCARAQWSLLCAMAALSLGFIFFSYRPTTRQLAELRVEIDSRRNELVANQSRTDKLREVALDVEQLKLKVDKYDKQMPRLPDVGQFLTEITRISDNSALREWDTTHGSPSRSELFGVLPVNIKFRGDFLNVVAFLRQVEDMTRLTRIRSLELKSRDQKLGQVDVELTMNIYYSE
jgi:Tfp pilus assembly protein PilO